MWTASFHPRCCSEANTKHQKQSVLLMCVLCSGMYSARLASIFLRQPGEVVDYETPEAFFRPRRVAVLSPRQSERPLHFGICKAEQRQ